MLRLCVSNARTPPSSSTTAAAAARLGSSRRLPHQHVQQHRMSSSSSTKAAASDASAAPWPAGPDEQQQAQQPGGAAEGEPMRFRGSAPTSGRSSTKSRTAVPGVRMGARARAHSPRAASGRLLVHAGACYLVPMKSPSPSRAHAHVRAPQACPQRRGARSGCGRRTRRCARTCLLTSRSWAAASLGSPLPTCSPRLVRRGGSGVLCACAARLARATVCVGLAEKECTHARHSCSSRCTPLLLACLRALPARRQASASCCWSRGCWALARRAARWATCLAAGTLVS